MKQGKNLLPTIRVIQNVQIPKWLKRYTGDTLLSLAGVALVTYIIASMRLYPRVPSSALMYLVVIVLLAGMRGHYAAILCALLSSFSFFGFFLGVESFTFDELDDFLNPGVFLATAVVTGQLTAGLRYHAEQAQRREREAHLLSEQAQELAAFRERQRLARELHDSVSQALYGISLGAHTAREALESNSGEVIAPLEYVIALAEAGLAEMRALIFELRPESMAIEGLAAALMKQVAVLRTRYKLIVEAQLDEEPALSVERKQVLYRIAQEALHNVVKHARASVVHLRLKWQDDKVLLEVCDDGRGFDTNGLFPGHLGLHSIQERATRLRGTCMIESTPGQGTRVCVCVPFITPSQVLGSPWTERELM